MNSDTDPIAHFNSIHPLRVRYNEADMQGIVFNANYLVYADIGVTEYFRKLAVKAHGPDANATSFLNSFGGDCWVRHAEVDFRSPAHADDLLNVAVRIMRFGRTSFATRVQIYRDETLLSIISLTQVWFDSATEKVAPVAPGFIAAVEAFENIPPERKAVN
jgi:acyl-CoA thioester hydrolase